MQLGRKSALNSERIELLNSVGFVWKLQGGRRRKSSISPTTVPSADGGAEDVKEEANDKASMPSLLLDPGMAVSPRAKMPAKKVEETTEKKEIEASSTKAVASTGASPAKKRKIPSAFTAAVTSKPVQI